MKLRLLISKLKKHEVHKTLVDYQQEILSKQGREQFKKLVDRGISIPVALL